MGTDYSLRRRNKPNCQCSFEDQCFHSTQRSSEISRDDPKRSSALEKPHQELLCCTCRHRQEKKNTKGFCAGATEHLSQLLKAVEWEENTTYLNCTNTPGCWSHVTPLTCLPLSKLQPASQILGRETHPEEFCFFPFNTCWNRNSSGTNIKAT